MIRSRFTKLKLIEKLAISFAFSAVCMISALIYAVVGLGTLHRMEVDIARNDLVAATLTITLRELLISQQRSVGKYHILRQPEYRELFEQHAIKFRSGISELRRVSPATSLKDLELQYVNYELQSRQQMAGQLEIADKITAFDQLESTLELLRTTQQQSLERKLAISEQKKTSTVSGVLWLAFCGVLCAFLVAGFMIYSFSSSIAKLKQATHRIAAGDFDHDPHIPPGDEIGMLAQDFMVMANRLKELEQISLDASPLTRLPGNIAIERSINRRLRDKISFTMCYLDLDNFKSYSDRYGYIRASEVLKETGQVIHEAVKSFNDPDAFVGHIGGDDFVVIITSGLAGSACQAIISDFDAMIPSKYSEEDRRNKFIEGTDRYGVRRRFPLISLSIAALECEPGDYTSAAEIATAAARLKDRVKESTGSNYMITREVGASEA